MALDGCGRFCKYTLFIFNFVFAVVGLILFSLGLWLRFSVSTQRIFEVDELNSSAFVTIVTILIILGLVMLIVAVLGEYGACSEKRCALQVFAVLLLLLMVAVVAVGVLAYSDRDEVGSKIAEFYTNLYTLYVTGEGEETLIHATLVFFHTTLHCCGITGVTLVEVVQEICPEPNGFFEQLKMDSCPEAIPAFLESQTTLMMGLFIGIAILLFIALICSLVLSKSIRQSTASPQCLILTNPTPTVVNLQPPPSHYVTTAYPYLNKAPVVITPLPVANIPVAQS